MEIRQFRVVVKARDFERTCRFYGETLALPRLANWDRDDGRGSVFQLGTGAVEVLGRPRSSLGARHDEEYDYVGPRHKLQLTLLVASAERVYEELVFRERNIPGGLRTDVDGALVFETHDPDGVRLVFKQEG